LVGVVVADTEYPKAVAERLLNVICEEFVSRYPLTTINDAKPNSLPYPELKNYLVKYQDPGSADSISKIQNELAETKTILYNTLEAAIGRGEKIDSLVAKSETLSAQSKMFYTQVGWSQISKRIAANISV
jgi:synaptobrevin family protein YKT6